jgi:hypothetical protein
VSRFRLTYGLLLPVFISVAVAVAVGCGGASDSSLFGSKPGVSPSNGGGGGTTSGAGGTSLMTEGSGGTTDVGAGGDSVLGNGGTAELDSGVVPTAGGAGGQGGHASGGAESSGGAIGAGGEAGVAWARCNTDSDCVGGRVCTKTAQGFLVSGRPGGCVHHCGINTAQCDPPPSVGTVSCTQLLVASFCTINCASGNLCPAGMDCVSGVCYYSM